jgi:SAM-dependent methyltransferase
METRQHYKRFNQDYFRSGTYEKVSFGRYSQYWWSNRFYAGLARRYGPQQGRVIEVGCGLGHLLQWFTDRYTAFGTDINTWALQEARQNVPGANFLLASAEDLGMFPDGSFSIVISKHVVEHLKDPGRAIGEMSRILAPGGAFILATPNLDSPMRKVKGKNWIGYRDATHISLKPPSAWLGYLKAEDLALRRVFSDGFWDAPYVPVVPARLQKLLFGSLGGLQAILRLSILPLKLGESMIVIAKKPGELDRRSYG